jgi:hypothetical protein
VNVATVIGGRIQVLVVVCMLTAQESGLKIRKNSRVSRHALNIMGHKAISVVATMNC